MLRKAFNRYLRAAARLLRYSQNVFLARVYSPPTVLSVDDTINEILKHQCSVSRYGDGELDMIVGRDQPAQRSTEELARRLRTILLSNEPGHLICLADVFSGLEKYRKESQDFWRGHLLRYRHVWYRLIDMRKVYFNAFITRCYYIWADKSRSGEWFAMMKKVWDQRDVILVEGEKSRLGVGNDLFNNVHSLRRILAPAEHAFSRYAEILSEVSKQSRGNLILIALGPTATILAYDLHKLGFQAIDIGHLDIEYEWYLRKAPKRIKIENKYVNEVADGREAADLADDRYHRQIAARIL